MNICTPHSIPRSDRTYAHVRTLAAKHPRTKFVSIVGDKCIPNLPDSRVPMFIVYRGGEIRTQIASWAADKERRAEGMPAAAFHFFRELQVGSMLSQQNWKLSLSFAEQSSPLHGNSQVNPMESMTDRRNLPVATRTRAKTRMTTVQHDREVHLRTTP